MSDAPTTEQPVELVDIDRCFGGAVPGVVATAGADGMPNVTYVTRAHRVGTERIALSNQFMSKTARNIATNPRASLLVLDPVTYAEYRLALVYERTERRGHVFERLRTDVEAIAALEGMQDVFRLRAADIYRVIDVAVVPPHPSGWPPAPSTWPRHGTVDLAALAELSARIGRCTDLDLLVDAALDGLDQLLGYRHSRLLLLDEEGRTLYTIGTKGFDAASIGAEVPVGDGVIGTAADRCEPIRVGALQQMAKYSRSVRRTFEDGGGVRPGREVPMAGLPHAESRLAVPAMARGELIGVLAVDSGYPVAFNDTDQQVLSVVATALASAVAHMRALEPDDDPPAPAAVGRPPIGPDGVATSVRYFAVDGSVFFGADYLIKGVAGRILWTLLRQHDTDGRLDFTNKELRLDPSLDMPGFKDNLESRLLLLKRR
ncbi:MAG: GAF domain-containing protein, partial [Ilumatobacteraceae bacterium]